MPALDLTELQTISREVIAPEIEDLYFKSPFSVNLFQRDSDINSRGSFLLAKVDKNPSIKWFSEGGAYPAGNKSRFIKMNVGFSRVAGTAEITGDVLDGANKQTMINTVVDTVIDTYESILIELSEQIYGDGSGVKAIVIANVGTTVYFYFNNSVVPAYARNYGTYALRRGGRYNFISGDGSARPGYGTFPVGTVLPIPATNNVATLLNFVNGDTAVFDVVPQVLLAGDMVVYEGSYQLAINGLQYHIAGGTGIYQGVSRNTNPELRSVVINAANGILTVAMLYRLIFSQIYHDRATAAPQNYRLLSSPAQAYQYMLLGDISQASATSRTNLQNMPDGGTLDYGFRVIKFAGLDWIIDTHCPDHELYLLDFNKFKLYEYKPLSQVFDGSGWRHVPAFGVTGGSYQDRLVYPMTWKGQFACSNPRKAGAKITNLDVANNSKPLASNWLPN